MATRTTRKQPFCWQEKDILRFLRKQFTGSELSKYRNLYLTLSEINSDFNNKPIKYFTKTLATYSGLSRDWIPGAIQKLSEFKILSLKETRDEKKRITGKLLIFTPENCEIPLKPNTRKPVISFSNTSDPAYKEDNIILEDNYYLEDNNGDGKNFHTQEEENRAFGMRQWQFIFEERQKKGLRATFSPCSKDKDRLQELAAMCNRNEKEFRERYKQYLEYPFNSKQNYENQIITQGKPLYGFVYFYDKMDGKEKSELEIIAEEMYAERASGNEVMDLN